MKFLLPYLKPYKKQFILGPMFKLIEAIFELVIPMVLALLIDRGVKQNDVQAVILYGAVILLLACVGAGSAYICQYFASLASQGFGTSMRNALFQKVGSFSYADLDRFGTSSLVNRITNDVNQVQVSVAMFIRLVIRVPFLVLGGLIMAMIIDLKMSLILIAIVPILGIAMYLIMRRSIPLYKKLQKRLDRIALGVKENLSGARVVRAFNKEQSQIEEFEQDNQDFCRAAIRINRVSSLLTPVTTIIINAAMIAILWFGGVSVNAGSLTQGEVLAYINYATTILSALIVLSNLVVIFTKAHTSALRIAELLDTEPAIRDRADAMPLPPDQPGLPLVEFRNVSFSYFKNADTALENISFSLYPGMKVGVIGSTGSGKSTLIHLLNRFYDVTEGEVLLNGADVRTIEQKSIRQAIGLVPQKVTLFSGTIRDNILTGKQDATEEEIRRALLAAQCDFAEQKGLDSHVEQGGSNFSGGQKQRLTIARALVKRPKLLILDDSLSALDYLTYSNLMKALERDYGDLTILSVTQRINTVKNSDLILVLEDGRLAGAGKHEDLLQSCKVYSEICSSQVE